MKRLWLKKPPHGGFFVAAKGGKNKVDMPAHLYPFN